MRVLHICNDYSWTKVHKNLFTEIDQLGLCQKTFTPLRYYSHKGNNQIKFKNFNSEILYSNLMPFYYKFFFRTKIKNLSVNLEKIIDVNLTDVIHATTLFSDGAIALNLFKKYGKPYIVTVRNSDVNVYLKLRPDLFLLANQILDNASRIVFISQANYFLFFNHFYFKKRAERYVEKSIIINNGIDDFWVKNIYTSCVKRNKVLFIGRFDKNKNVKKLINSLNELKNEIPDLELSLVGGGGNNHRKIMKLVNEKSWISFYGEVFDKDYLVQIFRDHKFFAMTSIYETFGLVYIEALSQGLPILYTKGQGVDGLFLDKIGEPVYSTSVKDIKRGIKDLLINYDLFRSNIQSIDFARFDWGQIANKYVELYKSILE